MLGYLNFVHWCVNNNLLIRIHSRIVLSFFVDLVCWWHFLHFNRHICCHKSIIFYGFLFFNVNSCSTSDWLFLNAFKVVSVSMIKIGFSNCDHFFASFNIFQRISIDDGVNISKNDILFASFNSSLILSWTRMNINQIVIN